MFTKSSFLGLLERLGMVRYSMAQSDCEEKERLLIAYDKASSELSDAVTALRKNEGVTGKDEYEALCRASEDAHMRTEQARLTFERHQQDHKCR
jgi:hypothetical protein